MVYLANISKVSSMLAASVSRNSKCFLVGTPEICGGRCKKDSETGPFKVWQEKTGTAKTLGSTRRRNIHNQSSWRGAKSKLQSPLYICIVSAALAASPQLICHTFFFAVCYHSTRSRIFDDNQKSDLINIYLQLSAVCPQRRSSRRRTAWSIPAARTLCSSMAFGRPSSCPAPNMRS